MAVQSNDPNEKPPEAYQIDDKAKFLKDYENWLLEQADALTYPEDETSDIPEFPNDDYSGSLDEI